MSRLAPVSFDGGSASPAVSARDVPVEALRLLAREVRARVPVPVAAEWFGFDYSPDGRLPCPACFESGSKNKTVQLLRDGAGWKCYRCDAGGDVISWLASAAGLSPGQAILDLAARLGIEGVSPAAVLASVRSRLSGLGESYSAVAVRERVSRVFSRAWASKFARPKRSDAAVAASVPLWLAAWASEEARALRAPDPLAVADGFARALCDRPSPPVVRSPLSSGLSDIAGALSGFLPRFPRPLALWESFGFPSGTAERFGVGYWPRRFDYEAACRLSPGAALACQHCGLFGSGGFALLSGRLVFPVYAPDGRVVAFAGRSVADAAGVPKYLNTPASRVYDKGAVLYGLHAAAAPGWSKNRVYVVEGYKDVIAGLLCGHAFVAPCGTGFSARHARLVSRVAAYAGLCFDPDDAGARAAVRCSVALRACGVRSATIALPGGQDPDEMLSSLAGAMEFDMLAESAFTPLSPDPLRPIALPRSVTG